ncbi:flagellar hook assembly protein FlgD [Thermithiobacillus plumbiphilus]|uniref:Basal-body rod modification protein FlgD n=1 Tax=Thermithiobacillus plumbiphilus TaxID=1729899 RepID=A0ABU9DAR7_9PROT
MVQSVNSAIAGTTSAVASQPGQQQLGQNEFLKLMTTQLSNQNPLEPMDNGKFLAEMAQFSTATGIQQLQVSNQKLLDAMESGQGLQAASLMGRSVVAPGSQLTLAAGQGASAGFSLEAPADSVAVSIRDAAGQVVRTLTLGAQDAGTQSFQWDGKTESGEQAAAGNYSFSVQALAGGKPLNAEAFSVAPVQSVLFSPEGVKLELGNGLGRVALSQIKQII